MNSSLKLSVQQSSISMSEVDEIVYKLDQNRNGIIDYKELLCNCLNVNDHLNEDNIGVFFSQIHSKKKEERLNSV